MYPSRKEALEMRILDLKTRLEELDSYSNGKYEWMITGFEELCFSPEELAAVDPQDFYSVREIQKAIDQAEEDLKSLGDE